MLADESDSLRLFREHLRVHSTLTDEECAECVLLVNRVREHTHKHTALLVKMGALPETDLR